MIQQPKETTTEFNAA